MTSDNVTGYIYFRNNVQISVRSSNSYTLSNNSRVDDGNYTCQVTTSKAPRSPKADPVAVMFLCEFMSWKCNEYPIVHFLTLFRQIFQIFSNVLKLDFFKILFRQSIYNNEQLTSSSPLETTFGPRHFILSNFWENAEFLPTTYHERLTIKIL